MPFYTELEIDINISVIFDHRTCHLPWLFALYSTIPSRTIDDMNLLLCCRWRLNFPEENLFDEVGCSVLHAASCS